MILTVTLNPATDRYISCENFTAGSTNYIADVHNVLGGKGINVSKSLAVLEVENIASGFSFGDTMDSMLNSIQLKHKFFAAGEWLRINYKIKDSLTDEITELNNQNTVSNKNAQTNLLKYITTTVTSFDAVVISGSLPSGCDKKIYSKIISSCKDHDVPVFADSSGGALIDIALSSPYFIKPNIHEFETLTKKTYSSIHDIANEAILASKEYSINTVCVSLGGDGAIVADNKSAYYVKAQDEDIKNTVGLGDAMVASFVSSYLNNIDLENSLINAAAFATATGVYQNSADQKRYYKKLKSSLYASRII